MRETLRIPVAVRGTSLAIAIDAYLPQDAAKARAVWYCFPGGSYSRRYYDLRLGADASRSFAAAMTARGDIVIAVDPVGIGDSEQPGEAEGFDLDYIVEAHGAAIAHVRHAIADGSLCAALPPLASPLHIGLGHSMGGTLLVLQQGAFASFDGVALLGSSTLGFDIALTEEERRYARDPRGARQALQTLAKARFGAPFPVVAMEPWAAPIFAGESDAWTAAIAATGSRVLAATALFCMLPDSSAPEASRIAVPVFIGFGDADIPVSPHESVKAYSSARDIELVILPDTGHMHFGFPTAPQLFGRLAQWSEQRCAAARQP